MLIAVLKKKGRNLYLKDFHLKLDFRGRIMIIAFLWK